MKKLLLPTAIIAFLSGCGSSQHSDERVEDPLYAYAWHLHEADDREFAEKFDIDPAAGINADSSTRLNGGEGVTVAILDDYFDASHPDIKNNVIATYNAHTGGTDVSAPPGATPHGQQCAGVVAAGENGTGVVGLAPRAKLILVGSAYTYDADIIRAFEFAKNHGADVISCSWGSYMVSPAVAEEIHSLYEAGITVVFAAGNDDADLDDRLYNDESELPWVIGVSASSEYNDRTTYANYGSAIDIFAPGGQSIGIPTTDRSAEDSDAYTYDFYSEKYLGKAYTFMRGTSAAAPLVAGAAALLKSADPLLTPDALRYYLIQTADKFGNAAYDENGFERYRAYGKLNVAAALHAVVAHKTIDDCGVCP